MKTKIKILMITVLLLIISGFGAQAQTITIPAGNPSTTPSNINDPFGTYWGYERTALIYTAAEIGGTTGNINKIRFYLNSVNSPGDAVDCRIYMKMRTTAFTTGTTYATEITGATLVYGPITIPDYLFIANNWITINLTTPFNYTGNNLEIIIETNETGTGNENSNGKRFRYRTQTSNYYQSWNADNTPPAGNGNLSFSRPNVQLVFCTEPANDNCSDVTPITLTCDVTHTFTGTGACSSSELSDPDFTEVWISFTLPVSMDLKIDFCGSGPIHDNAYLNVFTDCSFAPGTFTPASDWELTTCGDGNITLYWTELPAGNYWYPVLIDPAWESDYVANVTAYCCTRPVNDLCTSVTPVALTCGTTQTFTGTAVCSTPTPTFDPDYKDVWIAFSVPTSMDVAIDFCSSTPIHDDAYINVFPDCSFSTFTTASSWDFTSCTDGNITLFWTALAPGNYYYPIYIDNPSWEAPYTVNVLGTCPLPIELLSFNVSCTNDVVTLNWATATETNNDYFTIEKSSDLVTWKLVKQISGAGNSNQRLDYTITDEATGDTYYRLKQTDFDGKFEIFSPISVNCTSGISSPKTVSIHPNPTSGMLYIQTSGSEISGIQIFEDNGKTIYTGKETAINMSSFTPGLYFVKITTTSGDIFFRKVIKQ